MTATAGAAPTAAAIIRVFDDLFARTENTRLRGGAPEPLYTPAAGGTPAFIEFRSDYPSSALHEVAHWCIAGPQRRLQQDYGYWYAPDGRNAQQQDAFIAVEAAPQALEMLFSRACGLRFRVSMDNLDCPDPEAEMQLQAAVCRAAEEYRRVGLPRRAERFRGALKAHFHNPAEVASGLAVDGPAAAGRR